MCYEPDRNKRDEWFWIISLGLLLIGLLIYWYMGVHNAT